MLRQQVSDHQRRNHRRRSHTPCRAMSQLDARSSPSTRRRKYSATSSVPRARRARCSPATSIATTRRTRSERTPTTPERRSTRPRSQTFLCAPPTITRTVSAVATHTKYNPRNQCQCGDRNKKPERLPVAIEIGAKARQIVLKNEHSKEFWIVDLHRDKPRQATAKNTSMPGIHRVLRTIRESFASARTDDDCAGQDRRHRPLGQSSQRQTYVEGREKELLRPSPTMCTRPATPS